MSNKSIKYFFIFIILCAQIGLKGQISNRFVENDKEFLIRYQNIGCLPIMKIIRVGPFKIHKRVKGPNYYWKSFNLGCDTIINGTKYKIIERKSYGESDTLGFIRENENQEVFIFDRNMNQLNSYDFNLSVDDTLKYKIVSSIDTICNSGHSRVRYNFKMCCTDDAPEVLISGLGNMMNVIFPSDRYTTCDCYPYDVIGMKVGGRAINKLVRVKVEGEVVYIDREYQNTNFQKIDKEVSRVKKN